MLCETRFESPRHLGGPLTCLGRHPQAVPDDRFNACGGGHPPGSVARAADALAVRHPQPGGRLIQENGQPVGPARGAVGAPARRRVAGQLHLPLADGGGEAGKIGQRAFHLLELEVGPAAERREVDERFTELRDVVRAV